MASSNTLRYVFKLRLSANKLARNRTDTTCVDTIKSVINTAMLKIQVHILVNGDHWSLMVSRRFPGLFTTISNAPSFSYDVLWLVTVLA